MRTNLPVTATERLIHEGESIVSKTDMQGNITYVNPYFVEVSGFSEIELIGAPQNIIRHPDMPVEAFADMWHSIKAGVPWTGLVKNRCKNGDFYWILANVTPVREAGRTVGYMSVRTRASRSDIEGAEKGYKLVREKKAHGMAIREGALVPVGVTSMARRWRDLSLTKRIGGAITVLMLAIVVLCVAAVNAGAERTVVAGFGVLAIAVALYLWISLHSTIIVPLRLAIDVARAIAAGDLSSRFSTVRNDDVGQLLRALQQMNVNLTAIIGDVHANVTSIQHGTGEIASGNMDLSKRTEAQAASLEQTAASMEEFSATVKQNASAAGEADQLAAMASTVAREGGEAVQKMMATMHDISASSGQIVEIISLIDGIAFQTNILALNAAVEAARAGEQGRGFAVVAGEVRNLAQRSAAAAREIKTLIDISGSKVKHGTDLATRASSTMGNIVEAVERVTTILGDISAASREQSAGIEQVNQAVAHMDEVTQQNAALVEEAAAAAAALDGQAMQLSQAVSVFKVQAKAAPAAAGSRPARQRALLKAA
ncbi:methyl-accepting chemotaxis protein [Massilia sp. DWR3-1-1]|uniref:methyl-accepting chemotaxis protein n=1 Tax=Massilia sp. DWR3-1-1 TaxID=2804559 RepID=UPI003CED93D8